MIDQPEDYDDEEIDELAELLDACMLGEDGQCGLAGSEHCDWECPMRDSKYFAGSKAWMKAHGKP